MALPGSPLVLVGDAGGESLRWGDFSGVWLRSSFKGLLAKGGELSPPWSPWSRGARYGGGRGAALWGRVCIPGHLVNMLPPNNSAQWQPCTGIQIARQTVDGHFHVLCKSETNFKMHKKRKRNGATQFGRNSHMWQELPLAKMKPCLIIEKISHSTIYILFRSVT